jgi:hypothetical protein
VNDSSVMAARAVSFFIIVRFQGYEGL